MTGGSKNWPENIILIITANHQEIFKEVYFLKKYKNFIKI